MESFFSVQKHHLPWWIFFPKCKCIFYYSRKFFQSVKVSSITVEYFFEVYNNYLLQKKCFSTCKMNFYRGRFYFHSPAAFSTLVGMSRKVWKNAPSLYKLQYLFAKQNHHSRNVENSSQKNSMVVEKLKALCKTFLRQ